MFLLGHLGITSGVFYALERKIKTRIDYRYVLVGAIISDIVDKSISLVLAGNPFTYGRFIGHSLLFTAAVFALYFVNKKFLLLGFGIAAHLVLDVMWHFTETLFWPLSKNFNTFVFNDANQWASTIFQPYNLTGEVVGGFALLYLCLKYKIYIKDNFYRFLKTGYLE